MRHAQDDLAPELLIQAYANGYFPMADSSGGPIRWYTADPRAILPLEPFHVPRRVRRFLRSAPFTYTRDRDFEGVMRACGERPETWISPTMVRSYTRLHDLGYAHSVEVWNDGRLAGGLYGVHLGGAFFGESMFYRESGASKAALVHLAEHLSARDFRLLEIQMVTPLTQQFGARLAPRAEYLRLLDHALAVQRAW